MKPLKARERHLIAWPTERQGAVELAQAAVSFVREQLELMTAQTIHLQRAILDTLRNNVPLDPSDSVGRCGQNSGDDIKGAK
jgi:hypothetical protein